MMLNHLTPKKIGTLAHLAMLSEVSATPKPGLVDRATNGAHDDMDFFTFLASATALRTSFDTFAELGRAHAAEPVTALLPHLQAAGIIAEREMFAATQGVNTHKGMIFSLGLLAGVAGWAGARGERITAEHLCELAAELTHGLTAAACAEAQRKPASERTKGEAMYVKYGVTGVRGEAEQGFPSVQKLALPVYRQRRKEGASVNDALVDTLLALIAGTADTNILGRHDMEALYYAQAAAKRVQSLGGMKTAEGRKALIALDSDFTQRWLSPGGSADLIAVTHFLYEIEKYGKKPEKEASVPNALPSIAESCVWSQLPLEGAGPKGLKES